MIGAGDVLRNWPLNVMVTCEVPLKVYPLTVIVSPGDPLDELSVMLGVAMKLVDADVTPLCTA